MHSTGYPILLVSLLVVAIGMSACGSSSTSTSSAGNSNQEKLEAAESSSESQGEIEATLRQTLEITPDSNGVTVGEFTPAGGGECTVELVATGQQASMYAEDEWTVTSPDGEAAVKVVPTTGTPVSTCLKSVVDALQWGGD